jgi:hypothetical protein
VKSRDRPPGTQCDFAAVIGRSRSDMYTSLGNLDICIVHQLPATSNSKDDFIAGRLMRSIRNSWDRAVVRAHSVILITPVLPCKGAEGPAAFQTGDFAPRGDPAPGMDPRLTKWLGTGQK